MRQRHSCISHGSNVNHNALRSWHATMYKFVTSMVLCGLAMRQCTMHNATIKKTTFFELGVYVIYLNDISRVLYHDFVHYFVKRLFSLNYNILVLTPFNGIRICFETLV